MPEYNIKVEFEKKTFSFFCQISICYESTYNEIMTAVSNDKEADIVKSVIGDILLIRRVC